MLPNLQPDSIIRMYNFPGKFIQRNIKHGDIVVFVNSDTKKAHKDAGFVKRVIGVEGDKLFIKSGYVYLNNQPLDENYILKPRSTFGGINIQDCKIITIPHNKLFVLGDNRKASNDSREIGLIDVNDVTNLKPEKVALKYLNQESIDSAIKQSVFNSEDFVYALNKSREFNEIPDLKQNKQLSKSALLRARAMIDSDDLSSEASKSNYPMGKSMSDAGYYNSIYGEYPILGFYNDSEIITYINSNQNIKGFLNDKKYQDIGVASIVGEINGCPTQLTLIQVAGYVAPNYSNSFINSWKNTLSELQSIQTGWLSLKNNSDFYNKHKIDVDRINEIIQIRISNVSLIVEKINSNIGLNQKDVDYTYYDQKLYNEQESIAKRLISQH